MTHIPQLFINKQSADDQCYGHYKLPDYKSFSEKWISFHSKWNPGYTLL